MNIYKFIESLTDDKRNELQSKLSSYRTAEVWPEELEIARGQKILAIKAYRDRTGYPLKESKEAIEAAMAKAGIYPVTYDEMSVARTNKLSAIKMFRNRTGQDLLSAKNAIEAALAHRI